MAEDLQWPPRDDEHERGMRHGVSKSTQLVEIPALGCISECSRHKEEESFVHGVVHEMEDSTLNSGEPVVRHGLRIFQRQQAHANPSRM
jgi:hypothetical protein